VFVVSVVRKTARYATETMTVVPHNVMSLTSDGESQAIDL